MKGLTCAASARAAGVGVNGVSCQFSAQLTKKSIDGKDRAQPNVALGYTDGQDCAKCHYGRDSSQARCFTSATAAEAATATATVTPLPLRHGFELQRRAWERVADAIPECSRGSDGRGRNVVDA